MSKIYGVFLFVLVALMSHQAAFAAKSVEWKGTYSYEEKKRPSVHFAVTWKQSGKKISGKILEPNTFGDNGFSQLRAKLKGEINNNEVVFKKTYDGTAGVSHSVEYRGQFNAEKNQISGRWQIKDVSGPFVMEKAPVLGKNQAKK